MSLAYGSKNFGNVVSRITVAVLALRKQSICQPSAELAFGWGVTKDFARKKADWDPVRSIRESSGISSIESRASYIAPEGST